MADEKICVFCGQRPGPFRTADVQCGPTWQTACKSCAREVQDLEEVELCRRALRRGLAEDARRLEQRIELITTAEDHRLKCLRCGSPMYFLDAQSFDNSPMRDGLLSSTFDVIPAVCTCCGKIEFYEPLYIRKNKHLAYLIWKDRDKKL